jgi:tetratricopeptide (TPR) repeat protein
MNHPSNHNISATYSLLLDVSEKCYYLNNLGRYQEALDACNNAILLEDANSYYWESEGRVLLNLGRFDDAFKTSEKAIEVDENYSDAWSLKGDALKKLSRDEEAKIAYEKAREVNLSYDED